MSSVWVHLLKSGMINGTWGITSNQGKLWNIAKGEILNQGATEQRKTMRCRGDHVGHGGHGGRGEHGSPSHGAEVSIYCFWTEYEYE